MLRPKAAGATARFYAVVARDTVDADFAAHRQRFLAEQGYGYRIMDADGRPRRRLTLSPARPSDVDATRVDGQPVSHVRRGKSACTPGSSLGTATAKLGAALGTAPGGLRSRPEHRVPT